VTLVLPQISGFVPEAQLVGAAFPPVPYCEFQINSAALPFASVRGHVQIVPEFEQKGVLTGTAPTSQL
jgi:hypothetical protein